MLKQSVRKVLGLLEKYGALGLVLKTYEKTTEPIGRAYKEQYRRFLPGEEELQRERNTVLSYAPCISIVVPVYRTKKKFLDALITSIQAQTYPNWELCIADGGQCEETAEIIKGYQDTDSRIRYTSLPENKGISGNTNAAFQMATGEYIGLVDHDDVLSPNALYEVVNALNQYTDGTRPRLLYSDEDKVSENLQEYFEPHFKTAYNETLLCHYNYICHFTVFRRELLETVGMLDSAYDGAQDYDFVLRCTEQLKEAQICHIPKILYHWRVHDNSTAASSANKDYAYEAAQRAVKAHLQRCGINANVSTPRGREYVAVQPEASGAVRFVAKLGQNCHCTEKDWEKSLVSYFAISTEDHAPVGMVCGKVKSGNKIKSCGYTFDRDGNISPLFYGMPTYKKGYYRRAVVAQDISVGELDFCVIDEAAYHTVGGIDENLPMPYRNLDFAFRLKQAGYRIIVAPKHVAKVSGRREALPDEMKKAKDVVAERWGDYLKAGDPFYNRNLRKSNTFYLGDGE